MKRAAVVALLVAAVQGCAVGPNYKRPPVDVPGALLRRREAARGPPDRWRPSPGGTFSRTGAQGTDRASAARGFDPRLAAARVDEARALYGVSRADLFPSVGYAGGGARVHVDPVTNPNEPVITEWSANVNFQWELDLWGRIRRQNEAALAQYFATEDARRGVVVSLVADVATAYFQLRELDTALAIARRTTGPSRHDRLFDRRSRGAPPPSKRSAPRRRGQVVGTDSRDRRAHPTAENQMSFLLGQALHPIVRDGPESETPPGHPGRFHSTLLDSRPDILESEKT